MTTSSASLLVASAVAVLAVSGCGSTSTGAAGGSASSSAAPGRCDYISDSSGQVVPGVKKPSSTPSATGRVEATIATNFGAMPLTLDGDRAPCAVNSFLSLARQGYYDKTDCVRVTNVEADAATGNPGFHVLQCGDPTGTQAGTPGYRFAEEVDGSEKYQPGTIAMAKTSAPDTTGSQFFIVYGATGLPAQYTELGTLSAGGLRVAKRAAAAGSRGKGTAYDGPPVTKVTITSVTGG